MLEVTALADEIGITAPAASGLAWLEMEPLQ